MLTAALSPALRAQKAPTRKGGGFLGPCRLFQGLGGRVEPIPPLDKH